MMFSIKGLFATLSITTICHYNNTEIIPSVRFYLLYAECRYAECRYLKCRYAECRYAECHYAECRGAPHAGLLT
jgi:hypothetical protein